MFKCLWILILCSSLPILAQHFKVDGPVNNQKVYNSATVPIKYTILPQKIESVHTPTSLDVTFQWTRRNDSKLTQSLSAATGLCMDPNSDRSQSKSYTTYWKTPSCRFFLRYQATEWAFSFIFTPKYSQSSTTLTKNNHLEQAPITIPLDVHQNITSHPKCPPILI
ncbi:hypothetical protein F4703DRAFT_1917483 [Phycomyces blakesleeanus]|uniref:Secreted protein n=1 Tax=Phycomyces blakesleeanus (strain ATCC 8743b / DSM 1359 / FGSC 10004 / NBRC 33097 / NRRL 1555) TaxID=763407 RepID=A0A162PXE0_PHYB8|nr:hypothetical protein PHYBLDRAFT_67849 [Phycomyces blakesleeanus NRRL 1555(-)]OAD75086.1 hypothetical protein PHYBLDRAFT_67849 [Phycomyces blakesleeanus NRRL 1555(-)]|eukprot:XP_018293126.1 hypothetical protein PHYBLDRAFT_67849 [Phycomyces blakesleeanus NRRL 1555(-)]